MLRSRNVVNAMMRYGWWCQVQLPNGTAYISVTESGGGDTDADTESCLKKTIDSVGRRLGTSGRILAERRIRTTVD